MGDTLRVREWNVPGAPFIVGASYRLWPDGSITEESIFTRTGNELGRPRSERTWDFTNPGPPYRSGAAFLNFKGIHTGNEVDGACHISVPYFAGSRFEYVGGFVPSGFGPGAIPAASLEQVGVSGPYSGSYGSPMPYAATAYNRAKPKIEEMNLGLSIAELKDLPGTLQGHAKSAMELYKDLGGDIATPFLNPKSVSQEFLSHAFGWQPTVSDIRNLDRLYHKSQRFMDRMSRNNGAYGKVFRREVDKEDYTLIGTTYSPLVYPPLNGVLLQQRTIEGRGCTGLTRHYNVVKDEVWFEGSFMYYLPQFDRHSVWAEGRMGHLLRLMQVYGLRISPVTVYNLTPWSWLIDYFTNLGDVIEGSTALGLDAMVNKYAFIMRHTVEERVNNSQVFTRDGQTISASWSQKVESKRRERATPFGFSINMDDLSPMQIAILTALGISRT